MRVQVDSCTPASLRRPRRRWGWRPGPAVFPLHRNIFAAAWRYGQPSPKPRLQVIHILHSIDRERATVTASNCTCNAVNSQEYASTLACYLGMLPWPRTWCYVTPPHTQSHPAHDMFDSTVHSKPHLSRKHVPRGQNGGRAAFVLPITPTIIVTTVVIVLLQAAPRAGRWAGAGACSIRRLSVVLVVRLVIILRRVGVVRSLAGILHQAAPWPWKEGASGATVGEGGISKAAEVAGRASASMERGQQGKHLTSAD